MTPDDGQRGRETEHRRGPAKARPEEGGAPAPDVSAERFTTKPKGEHFDALLTDVVMPKMLGNKLAEQARRIRPGLSVLFMFIEKAFSGSVLLQRMREMLDTPAAGGLVGID